MLGVKVAASVAVLLAFLAVGILGPVGLARLRQRLGRVADRVSARVRRLHPAPPVPTGRPIELIAHDAHRLRRQFRSPPDRDSFARFEARRQAYDTVLAEACAMLGVDHLLGVLPGGPELDVERRRVETVLGLAGLQIDDAA